MRATQIRPGMIIVHEGELYTVHSVDHRTPGNKRGAMATRMRSLRTGSAGLVSASDKNGKGSSSAIQGHAR